MNNLIPTHAVKIIDNSMGDSDVIWLLAFIDSDGYVCSYDSGNRLIEYVGDKILHAWELKEGNSSIALAKSMDEFAGQAQKSEFVICLEENGDKWLYSRSGSWEPYSTCHSIQESCIYTSFAEAEKDAEQLNRDDCTLFLRVTDVSKLGVMVQP